MYNFLRLRHRKKIYTFGQTCMLLLVRLLLGHDLVLISLDVIATFVKFSGMRQLLGVVHLVTVLRWRESVLLHNL